MRSSHHATWAVLMALSPLMVHYPANAIIIPGTVFTVDSHGDAPDATIDGVCATATGTCTLRAAIEEANASPGNDTIRFSVTGTITLNGSLPSIIDSATIQGPGSSVLAISAANQFRLVDVNSSSVSGITVQVNDLTLRDVVGVTSGPAIIVQFPDALGLNNCVVTAMSVPPSSAAGVIANNSAMYIAGSELTANSGDGIVISNAGTSSTLTIVQSSISENQLTATHGSVTNWGGMVTIINSTISGNTGIGVYNNTYSPPAGTVNITSSTIVGNSVSGVSNATGGIINLKQTILAENGTNCSGVLPTSAGYNIEYGNDCELTMGGDQINTDPQLTPLANNAVGYPNQTRTHSLAPTSPAVDTGDATTGCPAVISGSSVSTDQRGRSRPYDGNGDISAICDIGAYEIAPGVNISVASQPLSTSESGASATLGIKLETQPTADVQVSISSNNTAEGTVAPVALTFTTSNWDTVQSVSVTGADDTIVDGAVRYEVLLTAASADPNYQTSTPLTVPAENADNDGSSSSSGGGGAFNLLWLFGLGFLIWVRRDTRVKSQ